MQKNKGITLIALVITIIILLILAGVAISLITGGEGLFAKTKDTKNKYTHASVYEALQLQAQNHQYALYAKETDKTLIGYLEEKEIVKQSTKNPEEYIVNVEKLSGKKIDLGNGTDEQTDVYKLVPRKSMTQVAALSITQLALYEESTEWGVWYFGTLEEGEIYLGDLFSETVKLEEANKNIFNYIINQNDKVEITGLNYDNIDCEEKGQYGEYRYVNNLERLVIPSKIEDREVVKVTFYDPLQGIDSNSPGYGACIYGIKEIIFPDTVLEIGGCPTEAFYDVEKIKLPANLKIIGDDAFYRNRALTTIDIPASVTSIGSKAFYWCTSLTTIEIPTSVTGIGDEAFSGCTALTTINIHGKDSDSDFERLGSNWNGGVTPTYLGKEI